jgi:hypothetical protein
VNSVTDGSSQSVNLLRVVLLFLQRYVLITNIIVRNELMNRGVLSCLWALVGKTCSEEREEKKGEEEKDKKSRSPVLLVPSSSKEGEEEKREEEKREEEKDKKSISPESSFPSSCVPSNLIQSEICSSKYFPLGSSKSFLENSWWWKWLCCLSPLFKNYKKQLLKYAVEILWNLFMDEKTSLTIEVEQELLDDLLSLAYFYYFGSDDDTSLKGMARKANGGTPESQNERETMEVPEDLKVIDVVSSKSFDLNSNSPVFVNPGTHSRMDTEMNVNSDNISTNICSSTPNINMNSDNINTNTSSNSASEKISKHGNASDGMDMNVCVGSNTPTNEKTITKFVMKTKLPFSTLKSLSKNVPSTLIFSVISKIIEWNARNVGRLVDDGLVPLYMNLLGHFENDMKMMVIVMKTLCNIAHQGCVMVSFGCLNALRPVFDSHNGINLFLHYIDEENNYVQHQESDEEPSPVSFFPLTSSLSSDLTLFCALSLAFLHKAAELPSGLVRLVGIMQTGRNLNTNKSLLLTIEKALQYLAENESMEIFFLIYMLIENALFIGIY